LRHLDLGRDAASLWRPLSEGQEEAVWAGPLVRLYREAPADERIGVQVAPLQVEGLDPLLALLRAQATPLTETLADLLLVEEPAVWSQWRAEDAAFEARLVEVEAALCGPLQRLRAALWARAEGRLPPLQVWDAAPLGPHGRALALDGCRRCAVSLAQPLEHVFCQIFHEETHAVADPETWARWRQQGRHEATRGGRDTHTGGEGYGLHREIEQHAIAVGAEVIAEALPAWMPAYERWCAPFV